MGFPALLDMEIVEGDATKQKSVKQSAFSQNKGNAVSERRLWQRNPQERQFNEEVRAIQ